MSMRHARVSIAALSLMLAAGSACAQGTAPMPIARRTAGILVADLTLNAIYLCRDLNNNGNANDLGEITVFVDGTNAAGLLGTGAVFSMYQSVDGTVYFGDGDTRAVYAAKDLNGDGDALDANELRLFFSDLNLNSFLLPTPNGIAGDANWIYVCNAGSGAASPQDGVFRVRDLNGDGNAQDAAESSLYIDLNTIVNGTICSPFDIAALNGAIYIADNRDSATPDRIYRAFDTDASGSIDATELAAYHTTGSFGGTSGFVQSCVTDGVAIYTHDRTASTNPQLAVRLSDSDATNAIDQASELSVIWSEASIPAGSFFATSQGFAVGPSKIALCSNGTVSGNSAAEVVVATDANNNGNFNDPGETVIFAKTATFPVVARQALFYAKPCIADFDLDGQVTTQDIFGFLNAWFASLPSANINGGPLDVNDIFDFLNLWFAGC
ncbi:MAG: hypothetical protein K2W85_00665 [Phycisphaerales bacterium]|nr:hypothetical protein [Phycisphaerales bacterium]